MYIEKIVQFVSGVKLSDFLINPNNIMGLIFNFSRDLKEFVKKRI